YGYINVCGGATLQNSGTFTLDSINGFDIGNNYNCTGTPGSLANTSTGVLTATAANGATIGEPLHNAGTISVAAGGSLAAGALDNVSGTDLVGGTYLLAGILRVNGAHILTNKANITLTGTGALSDGSVDALVDLATNAAGATLTLQGGRTLTLSGPLANAGTLGGSGTVVSSLVTNSGTVKPGGAATGILTITGAYTQTAAGALAVDINGTTVGTGFDRLAVSGTATLNGALNVASPFTPGLGNNFLVLTAGTRTGSFSTTTGLSPGGGFSYTLSYSATGLTLVTSALPGLQINNVSKVEGNSGTTNLAFTVTMSAASASSVTVQYATANGTAVAPGDYTSISGTLTFAAGQTSRTLAVPIVGDTSVEPDETFSLNLSSPTNAVLSVATGTGTITNDDFSADLGVTMTASPLVAVGSSATYQVSITNNGPTATTGVKLTDVLPVGTTLDTAGSSAGCTGTTTITCTVGAMATGGTASRTIALHTTTTGALTNTVTVSGNNPDPGPTSNTATGTTTVAADQADLEVTQSGPGSTIVGSTETYSVWVQDRGLFDTTAVVLNDALPAGSTYVSASPSQGTCSHTATTVTCPLGNLPVSNYAYVSIVVTEPATGASVTNTATATSAKSDSVSSNNSAAVTTAVAALVAKAGDDQVVTAGDTVTLDASASSPLDAVTSIDWDFGDGTTGSGQLTSHAYATAGDYTATVTVHAGASAATDASIVHVKPVPVQTGLAVTVRNDASTPVGGADVLVVDGNGVRYSDVTSPAGVAVLHGLPDGTYTVAAYKSGLLPGLTSGVVVANDLGTATVALSTGQLATTSVTSHPLTYSEIIAAGIDPSDPANQHVYEFTINLAFRPFDPPITLSGDVSGGGFVGAGFGGGGGGCSASSCTTSVGGYDIVITSQIVEGQPTLVYMAIPGRAKFLKEFFDVQLQVTNLAAPGFNLTGGTAELTLPPGISLAPTAAVQSTTVTMPDILGGTSATTNWVVRGDTEGFYDLAVDYRAMLSPFNAPVALRGETATPLHVWAGAALEMIVDADNAAYDGYPYRVRIGLHNVADVPVYNPSAELLPGPVNCVYAPGQTLFRSTDVIAPGDTFWSGDFVVIPNLTGQLDLSNSFVKKTAGDVDLADTIISHAPAQTPATAPAITATSEPNGVHLTWAPIAGATGYAVYSAPDRHTDFVGPLTGPIGAGTTDVHVVTPAGTRSYVVVPLPGPGGVIDMRHPVVTGTSLAANGPTTTITSPTPAAVVPNGTVTVTGTATDAGNGIGGVEVSTDNGVTWHAATGTTSWSYSFPSGAPGTVWSVQARSFDLANTRGVATSVSFSINLYASLSALVATIPGADTHKVNVLIDNVPIGGPLGNNQSTQTLLTAGPHNMSVTAAGDTDLSHYVVVFWGNCTSSGGITAAPDGVLSCAALLFNTSVPLPSLSVSDPVITRPSTGTAQAVFTVSMTGIGFFPTSVHYATQDGSATTAAGDYTAQSGTLNFTSGGPPTQTVSVPVSPTGRRGVNDSFSLVLSSASGATLADSVGTATLINRQGQFTASVKNTALTRSTTTAKTASFSVGLNAAPVAGEQVTVTVATADGSAVAGTDYTALPPTTLTFVAGEKTKVVTVPVAPRPLATPTRTFSLVLSAPSANTVLSDASGDATLASSGSPAPPVALYVSDSNILRPPAGSGTATFTVTLGAASAAPVTVGYATADGTATAAAGDYTPTSGTLTFAAGETVKTVLVPVFATGRHRVIDDFRLDLSGPSGAILADTSGTARLTNRNGIVAISVADQVVVRSASSPNTATVAVSLSAAPAAGETVTVAVATTDGTALAGTDYTSVTTTVTFNAGETTKYVTVPIASRPAGTPKRAFSLTLFGPSTNAYLADTAATINLIGP
ncbi:MAG: Calx-beta domain-containing protein, partial [Acidimicrobiales bacterium]